MELVVRDATVTIKPKDPNSKEMVILKDATVVTKTKDTIKIKPSKGYSVLIKNLNSLITSYRIIEERENADDISFSYGYSGSCSYK